MFESYLSSLEVKEEILELYYEVMADIFSSDEVAIKNESDALDRQIAVVEKQIQSAQDKYMDNTLDRRDYIEIKNRYLSNLRDLQAQKATLLSRDSSMKKYMRYALGLLQSLTVHYHEASFDLKHKLIGSIFPEKLVFDGSTYRTIGKNNIIDLLFNNSKGFKADRNKKAEKNSRLPYKGSPSWARTKDPIINSHVL